MAGGKRVRAGIVAVAAAGLAGMASMLAFAQVAPQPGLTQRFEKPASRAGGFDLPNGWRITPAGKVVAQMNDLVMKVVAAPDGQHLIAVNSGYMPHGLTVIDTKTQAAVQTAPLNTAWLGLAFSPDGKTLFVSGGNAQGKNEETRPTMSPSYGPGGGVHGRDPRMAPIYAIPWSNGKLDTSAMTTLDDPQTGIGVYWAGLAHHPKKPMLYAADRGTDDGIGQIVVFDTTTRKVATRIAVGVTPYETLMSPDGARLYVSNWSSGNISVIDTAKNAVIGTVEVGPNPNDMALSPDGLLYVACANDNSVHVVDTVSMKPVERIVTSLHARAPAGSTPNALALDAKNKLLFVANADNNNLLVADVAKRGRSVVKGFVPTGWYPSALTMAEGGAALYVGAAKGRAAYPDIYGPGSPLRDAQHKGESIKTLQTSTVDRIPVADIKAQLPAFTRQAFANTPYDDTLLERARASNVASVIPSEVGKGSPIKHVIYIIKENRTYDQVFGDIAKGNGDPRLTIFGRKVTPNHHALAEQYVLLDNLYCDGEVSQDGHYWSTAAYATDYNEKTWPANYGGHSALPEAPAKFPSSGYLWDLARRFNLTYRSYGEFASKSKNGFEMEARPGVFGLQGHVSKEFAGFGGRDTDNAGVFIREFDKYEANFDSKDPEKRLPNVTIMSLGEDHTRGTSPGAYTPSAAVASNDYALGMIVDRVSRSKYWAQTAIFVIEDDAQDGADHVDARRTVALAISPYTRRAAVDSTMYSTTSFVRTIELLLGLPPMSQYDAAARPLYASFGVTADTTPFKVLAPGIDIYARNAVTAVGAAESAKMNFAEADRAPMRRLNEIIWKSVKGANSPMPAPVHRFPPLADALPPAAEVEAGAQAGRSGG